jgi:CBS domain-containing protein
MNGTAVKSLPVLLHGRVVGVLSRRDLVSALARGDLDPAHTGPDS